MERGGGWRCNSRSSATGGNGEGLRERDGLEVLFFVSELLGFPEALSGFRVFFGCSLCFLAEGTTRTFVASAPVFLFFVSEPTVGPARWPVMGWRFSFSMAARVDSNVAAASAAEVTSLSSRDRLWSDGESWKTVNERTDIWIEWAGWIRVGAVQHVEEEKLNRVLARLGFKPTACLF